MQATLNRGTKKALLSQEWFWGILFLTPTIIGFLMFTVIPTIMSLNYSFTNFDGLTAYKYVGLKNYAKVLSNKEFMKSLWNTLYFTAGTVPLGCFLSLIIAVVLNQNIKGRNFYRTCYFAPTVVSAVAVSVVFQQIFNQDFGLANALIELVGGQAQPWLASKKQAMPIVIFVTIWQGMGTNVVIFLAGLTGVDPRLYEAAEIDGANAIQKFFKISLPMMANTITFILINNSIHAFQAFDQIYMLTGGGPAKATQTLSYLIYANAFEYFKQGYASAVAYVLFVIILIITVLQFALNRGTKQ